MTNFERKRMMALSTRSEAIILEHWPVYLVISVAHSPRSPSMDARHGSGASRSDFEVADMRDLSAVPESDLDVMLAAYNALPHLLAEQNLVLN